MRIKNYDDAMQLSNEIKSAKAKLRAYRKHVPAKLGKHLMEATRIPMTNKQGDPIMYKTKGGKKQRYRLVHSWKELTDKFYIAPKSKYRLVKKNQ